MTIHIRAETPADYPRIGEINTHAFDNRSAEAVMIALQRHSMYFDPDLSLVAELDGQVVGHALFSPLKIRLMQQDIDAVLLGPISVDPSLQQGGIGSALMQQGHKIAREKGAALSFLTGHPTYYPRFGYQTHAFGASTLTVSPSEMSNIRTLHTRKPLPADVPALIDLWRHEEQEIDFAIVPEASLLAWLSPLPHIEATIYTHQDEIVGFTRVDTHDGSVKAFFARGDDNARAMVAHLCPEGQQITLPLHPYSASAGAFDATPQVDAWEAAMVLPFDTTLFDDYMAQVQRGERHCGRVIWPVAFELDS